MTRGRFSITYGGPLVDAACELQARLYNVLALQFADRYLKNNAQDKKDAAIHSTLFAFAQFFGSREQRGLGERMINSANGRATCLGYAAFAEQRDTMDEWLKQLLHDLENLNDGGRRRLTRIQHLLLELVRELDDKGKRYPFTMNEA